jgi:hypothetical protein
MTRHPAAVINAAADDARDPLACARERRLIHPLDVGQLGHRHLQIPQPSVTQAVDQAVHRQRLAAYPGVLDDRGFARGGPGR